VLSKGSRANFSKAERNAMKPEDPTHEEDD
jgi:hypothetical protein